MDKNFTPPKPRQMFAPEPLSVRLRAWRPSVMQLALAISISLHAAILGARFVDPEDFNRVFQGADLEVILVNARTKEAPAKAQAIAQANLAGGGEAESGIATSPMAPSPMDAFGDDQSDEAKQIKLLQEQEQQVLTQLRHDIAAMPLPDPRKPSMTQEERQTEELRQRKLQQLAEIEKRINAENARPRRRYISPSTREEVYAAYTDSLRDKIEHRGTVNFPTINGHKLYGELTVNITVNSKGQVIGTEIVRSSNQRWLDQRSLAIIRAAAPFGDFTDDMKRKTDELVLTWRFQYTNDQVLKATMTTNGA